MIKKPFDEKLQKFVSVGKVADLSAESRVNFTTIYKYLSDPDRDMKLSIADKLDTAIDRLNNGRAPA